jgi:hypothetical protein
MTNTLFEAGGGFSSCSSTVQVDGDQMAAREKRVRLISRKHLV